MEGQKVIVAQGPGDFAINLQEALVSPLQIRVSQGISPVFPPRQTGGKAKPGILQVRSLPILILEIKQRIQHRNQAFPVASSQIMSLHKLRQEIDIALKFKTLVQPWHTPVKVGQKGLINLQFLFIHLFQDIQCVIFFDFLHGIIFVVLFMPECRHQSLRSNTHLRQDFPDNLLPHQGVLLLP